MLKYLNENAHELFEGKKLTWRGKVYWANMTTNEVYAMDASEYSTGRLFGTKVANIDDSFNIVKE